MFLKEVSYAHQCCISLIKNSNIVKYNFTFSYFLRTSFLVFTEDPQPPHAFHAWPTGQLNRTSATLCTEPSVESVLAPSWQVSWCLDPVRQKCKTNRGSNPLSMQEMKGYKELIKQENMLSYNPADGESHCVTILQNQTWGILKHVNTLHRQVVI